MPGLPIHTLNDGTTLPAIGLGTYALRGIPGAESMADALRQGYRLLDSAVNYENEGAVGKAVRMSGVPRDRIRVTSKLPSRKRPSCFESPASFGSAVASTSSAFGPCSASSAVLSLTSANSQRPWAAARKCAEILARFEALHTTSTSSAARL